MVSKESTKKFLVVSARFELTLSESKSDFLPLEEETIIVEPLGLEPRLEISLPTFKVWYPAIRR